MVRFLVVITCDYISPPYAQSLEGCKPIDIPWIIGRLRIIRATMKVSGYKSVALKVVDHLFLAS
ncbi:MAG: hypothetical protein HXS52_05745 [Theionarchaea archaeon]|nr:hypothetical protein [Theionarchaea archaeon]